jgi:HAD superfamily hydrolase (TIGR01509 family)
MAKFIFDFDDVLFHTTKNRVEHFYPILKKEGVSQEEVDVYYEKNRGHNFSIKKLLTYFSLEKELYKKIMSKHPEFVNKKLLKTVKDLGKENCYIVTYGDKELQKEKVKKAGIAELFREILVTSGSKKAIIEKICARHKNEEVIFIDDKAKYFEDLDFQKCPNLKTILYTGQKLKFF